MTTTTATTATRSAYDRLYDDLLLTNTYISDDGRTIMEACFPREDHLESIVYLGARIIGIASTCDGDREAAIYCAGRLILNFVINEFDDYDPEHSYIYD